MIMRDIPSVSIKSNTNKQMKKFESFYNQRRLIHFYKFNRLSVWQATSAAVSVRNLLLPKLIFL